MKKKVLIIAVALVLAAAISLAGCDWLFGISGDSQPQRYFVEIGEIDDSGAASYVANNTIGSVVQINVLFDNGVKSASTGFFISSDGYVVTNRHCVVLYSDGSDLPSRNNRLIGYKSLVVTTPDGKSYNAEYVTRCETADVAVIKVVQSLEDKLLGITHNTFTPLEFDLDNEPYYGDTVFTMGNPENLGFIFTKLMISCPAAVLNENDGFQTILLDGNINHGNSGGPLLDVYGHVVGIIYARIEGSSSDAYGIGCAISAKDVTDFLDERNIAYSTYVKNTDGAEQDGEDFT